MKVRNTLVYFLLNVLTLGIYGLVVQCKMGNEINEFCQGDGKKQMHYFLAFLLGCITFGIYPYVWLYQAVSRMEDNAYRYRVQLPHNASETILWGTLGTLLLGIGIPVMTIFFIDDVNQYAKYAIGVRPLPYTPNFEERNWMMSNPEKYMSGGSSGTNADSDNKKDSQESAQGIILCLAGQYKGQSLPMEDGQTITIGRNPKLCDLVLDNQYSNISGKHVVIQYLASQNQYVVTDCSTNGTSVHFGGKDFFLEKDKPTPFPRGVEVCLVNKENLFVLK